MGATEPSDLRDGPEARLAAVARRHDVEHDGVRVAWRAFGDGPPLVLLHGGFGSWRHWLRNIPAWSRGHTVWAVDLPGYGDSDAPAAPTLDSLLGALTGSWRALAGERVPLALAGFSFGGLVAAHWAARDPSVRRLALLGAVGHGGPRRPRGEMAGWREAAQAGDERALAAAMRHNLAMHMLHDPAAIDDDALALHTDGCRRTRFHSKPISRGGTLAAALRAFDGPVLLLWGAQDITAHPEELTAALAADRPRVQRRIVDGAGHWVSYEAAGIVNETVEAWLAATADH